MKISSTPFQRFHGTLITLAFLILAFLIYFFIFVEGKKNYLHERAFRVLSQDEYNLNGKMETVQINARREISWRRTIEKDDPGYHELFLDLKEPSLPIAGKFNQRLEFTAIEQYQPSQTGNRLAVMSQPVVSKPDSSSSPSSPAIHSEIRSQAGKWRVYFEDTVNVERADNGGLRLKESLRISYNIGLKDFLETALIGKEEVFDEYLLLDKSAVVYESTATGLRINTPDSLFTGKSAVQTGTVRSIELAGISYQLFIQKINIGNIPDLTVGGLIRDRNYRSQIYSVPLLTILFSILLMLLLALGYPFFKLMIMSSGERLQSSDAFFSVFSVIAGAFVIAIVLLSGYLYRIPDWEQQNNNLSTLADSIRQAFRTELNSAYSQLAQYKQATINKSEPNWFTKKNNGSTKKMAGAYENILCVEPTCQPDSNSRKIVKQYIYPRAYPYFNNVFWIDDNGLTQQTWIIDPVNTPSVEVKDRQYFRKIKESDTWNLNLEPGKPPHSFVIEPIFNRINSQNTVVMSIPFDSPPKQAPAPSYRPVMAMEMRLHSVLDPVLPLGYGFSIIDKDGLVWFHSDEKKNLQEKFLKECGDDKNLLAMLEGNNSGHLNLSYNGQSYRAYVTPFRQLPLYLIVFYDDGYYKSVSSMAISTAAIDYVMAFLPLLVLLLVHKLTFQSDLRLRGENYSFSWLSPRNRYQPLYPKLVLINFLLGLVDAVVLWKYHSEFGVWMIFTFTISLSFTATRLLLYQDRHLSFFRKYAYWFVFALFIGLAFLFAATYQDVQLFNSLLVLLVAGLLLGLTWNYESLMKWSNRKHWLKKFHLSSFGTTLRGLPGVSTIAQKLQVSSFKLSSFRTGMRLPDSYLLWLSSWVMVLSVLPAIAFYTISYDREQRIATSHYLIHLANDLTQRKNQLATEYNGVQLSDSTIRTNLIEQQGKYLLAGTDVHFCRPGHSDSLCRTDNQLASMNPMLFIRPLYNQIVAENNYLLEPDALNGNWNWFGSTMQRLQYRAYDLSEPQKNFLSLAAPSTTLHLSYLFLPGHTNWTLLAVLVLVTMFLFLFGLYGSIRYVVKHLFNTGLYESSLEDHQEKICLPEIRRLVLNERQRVFLSGPFLLDNEYEMERLLQVYQRESTDRPVQLINLLEVKNGQKALAPAEASSALVITHFEELAHWHSEETSFNEAMDQLYENVINHPAVLIVSQREPFDIRKSFRRFNEGAQKEGEKKNDALPKSGHSFIVQQIPRWESLLSGFIKGYCHLNTFADPAYPPPSLPDPIVGKKPAPESVVLSNGNGSGVAVMAASKGEPSPILTLDQPSVPTLGQPLNSDMEWWARFIRKECKGNGPFLENLSNVLIPYFREHQQKGIRITKASIILKAQNLAAFHYYALWKSCTREEQYVLYDLAQDGLVNSKNLAAIRALAEKGLLKYDGTIRLFNRSFKNYILASVQPREGLLLEREGKHHGAWNEFKTPLLLVVVAIIGFIFLTQRETFNHLIAIVTTITASIPLLLKFVSMFSFGNQKGAAQE